MKHKSEHRKPCLELQPFPISPAALGSLSLPSPQPPQPRPAALTTARPSSGHPLSTAAGGWGWVRSQAAPA